MNSDCADYAFIDVLARVLFNENHFEENGDRSDGLARYKITIETAYRPELACTIHKEVLTAFLNLFVDSNLSIKSLLIYGNPSSIDPTSEHVLIGPSVSYINSRVIRYLATDLLRLTKECKPVQVFNMFYSGRGNDWREI